MNLKKIRLFLVKEQSLQIGKGKSCRFMGYNPVFIVFGWTVQWQNYYGVVVYPAFLGNMANMMYYAPRE
jgi:hypothetical protein